MLSKTDVFNELRKADAVADVVLLFGTALVMRGIIEATNDIDCYVSESLFKTFEETKGFSKVMVENMQGEVYAKHTVGHFDFDLLTEQVEYEYENVVVFDEITGKSEYLRLQTVDSILSKYKQWNRPKDRKRIFILNEYMQ